MKKALSGLAVSKYKLVYYYYSCHVYANSNETVYVAH